MVPFSHLSLWLKLDSFVTEEILNCILKPQCLNQTKTMNMYVTLYVSCQDKSLISHSQCQKAI